MTFSADRPTMIEFRDVHKYYSDYHALREGVSARPPASVAALWRPWRRMVLK